MRRCDLGLIVRLVGTFHNPRFSARGRGLRALSPRPHSRLTRLGQSVAMTNLPKALAALSVSALLTLGAPAYASHGGDDPAGDDHGGGGGGGGGGGDGRVVKTGSCTDGSRWKLKVKNDDGRLEVEGEVDSNTSGQTWAGRSRT